MKKILIFSYQLLGTGGTESVLNAWSKKLESESDKYHIELLIYGNPPDHSFFENKKIKNIPIKNGFRRLLVFKEVRDILNQGNYDIIICLGLNFLKAISYAVKFIKNKPKIVYWTHFRVESINSKTDLKLLQNADAILSLCEGMTNQFLDLNIEKKKIHTIYNPIEKSVPKNNSEGGKRFWYVGRLDEHQKRVSDLLRVFYLLRNLGYTDFQLDILGVGESVYYYTDMLKRFNLHGQVKIHDVWLRKPWDFIDEIDCLILPSNYEGFGLVICEALARGIPAIVSNCPVGPSDIIKPDINGYIYEVGDLIGLKNSILAMALEFEGSKDDIMSSIDRMYTDNYFRKLESILDNL